jgi:hypothetical protein
MSFPPETVRPGAVLDFEIDWLNAPAGAAAGYLGASTINSATWTLSAGLAATDAPGGQIPGGTLTRLNNVSGFADGQDYTLTCEIVFGPDSNRDSRVINVRCRA